VHYLTKYSFQPVVRNNPYIDHFHYLADSLDEVIVKLRAEQFDFVADLHHNVRSLRVRRALGVPSAGFPKLNLKKWLYTNLKIDLMPPVSIVERYFTTVKRLGVKNDGRGLDYFIDPEFKLKNQDIPMSHWNGYVGCVIGGSYATKQLPVHQWQTLCRDIPYPIILLGGPDDRAMGMEIAELDPIRIYNSCGKFSLNESAELVDLARVIVTNDTGLMHIAAAYKKPIVSLWGNTTPQMGMFPYYGYNNLDSLVEPRSVMIENKDLSCRPCSKLGYRRCPRGHFDCMNRLDLGVVVKSVMDFWAASKLA
jgi:heptosyltransferase-2